jgi:hypothetical protein
MGSYGAASSTLARTRLPGSSISRSTAATSVEVGRYAKPGCVVLRVFAPPDAVSLFHAQRIERSRAKVPHSEWPSGTDERLVYVQVIVRWNV